MPQINKIVIHCSATRNGHRMGYDNHTAAEIIDGWHAKRGFKRQAVNLSVNPHLKHIGYHYVIDTDGYLETGRAIGEIGAHVKGHNKGSIGICLVGGIDDNGNAHGEFTAQQWQALTSLLQSLAEECPNAKLYGHRDLSPDLNGDGKITPNEWTKQCPCFDVLEWLDNGAGINVDHLYQGNPS